MGKGSRERADAREAERRLLVRYHEQGDLAAREELCALPGVGRKTAACVLLFSFGRPDPPVDTHVYRVGTRLGLWAERTPLLAAHDELARLCGDDAQFAYETHVLLIRHGRRTCVARSPRCAECPLQRMCPEGRRRLARP